MPFHAHSLSRFRGDLLISLLGKFKPFEGTYSKPDFSGDSKSLPISRFFGQLESSGLRLYTVNAAKLAVVLSPATEIFVNP
jgi:hypothetical protein